MIRRGTRASRLAALSVAFGPFIVAVLAFGLWAGAAWWQAGQRIATAQQALHGLDARESQAELYAPLGESWADFAGSNASGLLLEAAREQAVSALIERIETAFAEAPDGRGVATPISFEESRPGLEKITLEVRGVLLETGVPALLEKLERREPFIFVDALDLRRVQSSESGALMELRLRVSAYRIAGAPQ